VRAKIAAVRRRLHADANAETRAINAERTETTASERRPILIPHGKKPQWHIGQRFDDAPSGADATTLPHPRAGVTPGEMQTLRNVAAASHDTSQELAARAEADRAEARRERNLAAEMDFCAARV
jgi:hypothetical protein